jgi:PAS domain S-box-containing protein
VREAFLKTLEDLSREELELSRLHRKNAELIAIFDQSPIAIVFYDPDGRLEMANDACCEMFGVMDRSEIAGFKLFDDPNISDSIKSQLRSGKTLRYEADFDFEKVKSLGLYQTTKSGSRMLDVLISPIRDDFRIIAYIAQIQDVMLRKQTEDALRESEARWQFALEGAGDGVWDWNPQTDEVYFSRQWKAMLGFEEDEIGNTLDEWSRRVHPEDIDRVYRDIGKHLASLTPAYMNEHRMLCKDGSYKWILDRGKVIQWTEDGKPLRVVGTHSDITERKRAEENLRESEERFRLLAETIQDVFWITTPGGERMVYVSPAYEKVWGRSVESVYAAPRSFLDPIHPEERERVLQGIQEHEKGAYECEYRVAQPDGSMRCVHDRGFPIRDAEGRLRFMAGIARDITAKKDVEKALQEANEELESRVEEKTSELKEKTKHLEEINIALRVLLDQRGRDKQELEESILSNIKNLVRPYLEKLKQGNLPADQRTYLTILDSHIEDIASRFTRNLSLQHLSLTPTELRVAALVRDGRKTKDISEILCISEKAVSFHRDHIRRKLGLRRSKTNLQTYLASFL